MADGSPQTFNNWDQVSSQYGTAISDQLQALNVPISQVGQLAQQYGSTFGMAGSQMAGGGPYVPPGFYQALAGGGQGGGQQGPPPGTIQLSGAQDPAFASNLLGAQALRAVGLNPSNSMTVNATPGSGSSPGNQFQQSGVTPVSGPTNYDISGQKMPTINPQLGSVFNAIQPLAPTISGPMRTQPANTNPNWGNMTPTQQNAYMRGQGMRLGARQGYSQEQNQILQNQQQGLYMNPTAQPTGAQATSGVPFATPPQIPTLQTPQVSPQIPASTGTLPQPPAAPGNAIAGSPFGPISGLSPNATPPGPASLPPGYGTAIKHMAGGGSVGNTDTVPAMLTPGEYVLNRDAAQQIGRGRLDQLNAGGPIHMQGGGEIPGTSPSSSYSLGADPQNTNAQSSDAQSYAFNQLTPQEQVALQGGGAGGQRVQQKYNQLVNNYQGSSGSPTPMSAQMGGMSSPAATTTQVHPQAPAAPAGQPQQQQRQPGYSGSLDQWLSQYGHTPQGQAYIAQNGNVNEVQRYLQNLTTPQTATPQTGTPAYTDYAPRASLVSAPAGYGAAPRAELVGLPAGQGEAYDPKTYGINTGASPAAGVAGNIAGAIGQVGSSLAQALTKGASQPYRPIQSAIPSPSDFKRQTPDIVLQGHQVNRPNTQGGYVLMAQPHDQGGEDYTGGYLS
jgi:hypothetical protein